MDSEGFARICFETVAAPLSLRRVSQQSHGEHDFDIIDATGMHVGVMEVTTAADQSYVETMNAVFGEKNGRGGVAVDECANRWFVTAKRGSRISRVRQGLDQHLADIERAGLTEFDADDAHPAVRAIRELGVARGRLMAPSCDGSHQVAPPANAGWVDEHAINKAVLAEADKQDNRRKLCTSSHKHRHLFVYVDMSSVGAYVALGYPQIPPTPMLPEEVTHVWAGTQPWATSGIVLYAANGGPWARYQVQVR